jgi:hypothetical protein
LGARSLVRGKVGGREPERLPQELAVADERETAVVGHVQPLVAVGDHRIRPLHALGPRCGLRCHARKEPERTVDMKPGAVLRGEIGHPRDWIEVAGVHVAGVADDDGGSAAERRQPALQAR